jgi:multimeric flavodoxin WrbA
MNVLGISGSLNLNGNTAFAVRHALAALEKDGFAVRFLSLAGREIHPCDGCYNCQADHACIFDDGMTEIVEGMRWCDGLILGSPVYMGLVSGPVKTMMDRTVVLRPSYEQPLEMSGKVGGGIACAGFRNGGQETTLLSIQIYLLQQNMLVINDGAPYSHAGGAIAGEAKDDGLGLRTVESLAANMAKALKRTSPHPV